jgi:hypothetical protein
MVFPISLKGFPMCLSTIEVFLFIYGLIAVITRKFILPKNLVLTGKFARVAGVVTIIPLLGSLVASLVLAGLKSSGTVSSAGSNFSFLFDLLLILICLAVTFVLVKNYQLRVVADKGENNVELKFSSVFQTARCLVGLHHWEGEKYIQQPGSKNCFKTNQCLGCGKSTSQVEGEHMWTETGVSDSCLVEKKCRRCGLAETELRHEWKITRKTGCETDQVCARCNQKQTLSHHDWQEIRQGGLINLIDKYVCKRCGSELNAGSKKELKDNAAQVIWEIKTILGIALPVEQKKAEILAKLEHFHGTHSDGGKISFCECGFPTAIVFIGNPFASGGDYSPFYELVTKNTSPGVETIYSCPNCDRTIKIDEF